MNLQQLSLLPPEFEYQLHRSSRRRTLEVQVRGDEVVVRVPSFVSQRDVQKFLRDKSAWVHQRLAEHRLRVQEFAPRHYQAGARWWFLGEPYTLHVAAGPRDRVWRQDDHLVLQLRAPNAAADDKRYRLLASWYQDQARQLLLAKVEQLTAQLGLRCGDLKLRKTRSRWGHCTHDGRLQFNWLVLQAPESVVDYLVAHEVCHLRHFNHSKAFWNLVARACPDYQQQRAWLKQYGHCLWF